MSMLDRIGKKLERFGGVLRCKRCGREESIGDVSVQLAQGWPQCCRETMEWITRRQLEKQ